MSDDIKYNDLKSIYSEYFSLSTLGTDFSNRLALISLICYLYSKLKLKIPDLTYWNLIYKLGKNAIPEKSIKGLSIMCEDISQNCNTFLTFGLEDKQIPKKIQEILHEWLPF